MSTDNYTRLCLIVKVQVDPEMQEKTEHQNCTDGVALIFEGGRRKMSGSSILNVLFLFPSCFSVRARRLLPAVSSSRPAVSPQGQTEECATRQQATGVICAL